MVTVQNVERKDQKDR